MHLSVWKIKSKRCSLGRKTSEYAFVQNLFVDVANVACTGQNAYAPVTHTNHVSMLFCKIICDGTIYETLGL